MSHIDEAVKMPEGFEAMVTSEQGAVAAVEYVGSLFYVLQYHPQV